MPPPARTFTESHCSRKASSADDSPPACANPSSAPSEGVADDDSPAAAAAAAAAAEVATDGAFDGLATAAIGRGRGRVCEPVRRQSPLCLAVMMMMLRPGARRGSPRCASPGAGHVAAAAAVPPPRARVAARGMLGLAAVARDRRRARCRGLAATATATAGRGNRAACACAGGRLAHRHLMYSGSKATRMRDPWSGVICNLTAPALAIILHSIWNIR
eukprot:scaffold908_cov333-Prasinococcus_capsulatus_cf.AAC.2